MRSVPRLAICFVALALSALGEPTSLVVTTSMLESAVRDYSAALPADLDLVRLVPPGSCPGHFDLSPRTVPLLRQARLVVRHDYQEALDQKMRKMGGDGLRIQSVPTQGSLLIPENYAKLSADVAEVLAAIWPDRTQALRNRHKLVAEECAKLGEQAKVKARAWRDAPLLASGMQKEFCVWLGLSISAVLPRPDDTTPRTLVKLLRSDAGWIAGNLQSDGQAAQSLGRRKRVPVAVLSNFPLGKDDGYRELLTANLAALEEAWRQR